MSKTRQQAARERRQAAKRLRARRRQRQQDANDTKQTIPELVTQIQAAQQLYNSDQADPLIGEAPAAYGTIQKALEASQAMFWAFCKSIGARGSARNLREASKSVVVVLDLGYRMFAAGVDHGRRQVLGAGVVDQDLVESMVLAADYLVKEAALKQTPRFQDGDEAAAWYDDQAARIKTLALYLEDLIGEEDKADE